MVKFANAGEIVVRLKGSDPLVFGRGGEEIAALQAAGVAVRVIPGTAGLDAAASLGLPLTRHRRRPSRLYCLCLDHRRNAHFLVRAPLSPTIQYSDGLGYEGVQLL